MTIAQTALTLALLVGAGLLIRTMVNVSKVASGYSVEHILSMTVTAVQGDWMGFHTRALERVSMLPGVEGAAFAWGVPLTGNNWPGAVELEGQPPAARATDRLAMPLRSVTPGYFALLGLNFIEGRDFRNTDGREAPPVAIVNQALAEKYFNGTTAVGKKFWLFTRDKPPTEIIGVVTNGRTNDLTRAAEPEIYTSLWQRSAFSKDLIVRTAGDPAFDRGRRPARAANGRSDGRHGKREDDGADSRRFAGIAHVCHAAAGRVRCDRHAADPGGDLWGVVAVGRITAPGTRHPQRGWRAARRHPVADS